MTETKLDKAIFALKKIMATWEDMADEEPWQATEIMYETASDTLIELDSMIDDSQDELLNRFHEAGWRIADDGDPYKVEKENSHE